MKHILNILKTLVSFDTSIERSTLEAAHYVANIFEDNHLPVKLIYKNYNNITDNNRATVIARIGNQAQSGIVLSGHLDTYGVSQQLHNWLSNPFKLTYKEDKVIGRGVVDMKGAIAVSLALIPFFKQTQQSVNFVFTHDEEGGFTAINQLSHNNFYNLLSPSQKCAIVMEPTKVSVKTRHKGYRRYKLSIENVPFNDIPSIEQNIKNNIEKLHNKCNWQKTEAFDDKKAFLLFKEKSKSNRAEIIFQYRYEPNDMGKKQFEKRIPILLNLLKKQLIFKYNNPMISFILEEQIHILPLHYKKDLINYLPTLNPLTSYGTEAGYFQQYGIPTFIVGPGDYSQAHRSNETISLNELNLFKNFLMSFVKQRE